jgi:FOG: GGDEF domain
VHGAGEISCSIGCSRYPFDADNFEDLYKSADRALYETKHRGKHGYTIAGTQ